MIEYCSDTSIHDFTSIIASFISSCLRVKYKDCIKYLFDRTSFRIWISQETSKKSISIWENKKTGGEKPQKALGVSFLKISDQIKSKKTHDLKIHRSTF